MPLSILSNLLSDPLIPKTPEFIVTTKKPQGADLSRSSDPGAFGPRRTRVRFSSKPAATRLEFIHMHMYSHEYASKVGYARKIGPRKAERNRSNPRGERWPPHEETARIRRPNARFPPMPSIDWRNVHSADMDMVVRDAGKPDSC